MQLNISGHHLDITDAIKQHSEEKLAKIKHHFDHVININMILEVEKEGQYETLKLVPAVSWRGMDHYLRAYRLESTALLELENADFYTKSTVAIALELDIVTEDTHPYIFILTKDEM